MPRLFVGLELPQDVRERLAGLRRAMTGARWVAAENLHLTVRFLGEVDMDRAREIDMSLAEIRASAFDMRIRSVGHFGSMRRGGILWAGVDPDPALSDLVKAVDRAAAMVDDVERRDKPFHPHVTLARLKHPQAHQVAGFLSAEASLALDPVEVAQFALFSSTLAPDGARYRVEADYPLLAYGTAMV